MNNLTVLNSTINKKSEEFISNYKKNKIILDEFEKIMSLVTERSESQTVIQHKSKGKLHVYERIELLIDKDTPFLELSPLAAFNQYENQFFSAGIITGIGYVEGKETIIIANDATVKGGTYIKETIKKHLRAQKIALQNNLPCIYLVESGGIYLQEQANVFADKEHFGRIFYNQAKLSAAGIPQVAIVMGSCTAGGAYIPAMSDESIIVKNQGTIFLGGPPLVKAATGEDVTAEELGGAYVHTSISGVADHLAENDEHAIEICRNIFSNFNSTNQQKLEKFPIEDPLYDIDDLYGILQSESKKSTDVYEIIARIVDGSKFQEFKANYGQTLVTGYARIMGYPIGIVANNGILFSESAQKGTHFIELCNHRKFPIVFLQNISGFIVGKSYEHQGIAKEGAKMVQAVSNANVPKFTIIFGSSHGAGNYAMAGRAFNPNLLFMWPNSKISVMGGEQASEVLTAVKYNSINESNHEIAKNDLKKKIKEQYEAESSAYFSTSRIWDDGIIDPADTRVVLAIGISMSLNKQFDEPKHGIYRM
jgi:acetyl-CoA carboxylase carboxyltransferase component